MSDGIFQLVFHKIVGIHILLPHDFRAKAQRINAFAQQYCEQHGDMKKVKDILPHLIQAGILDLGTGEKDVREILRQVDDAGLLDELMPAVAVDRKPKKRYWFFCGVKNTHPTP